MSKLRELLNGKLASQNFKNSKARKRVKRKIKMTKRWQSKSRPSLLPKKLPKSRKKHMKLKRSSTIVRTFTPRRRCLQLNSQTMILIL